MCSRLPPRNISHSVFGRDDKFPNRIANDRRRVKKTPRCSGKEPEGDCGGRLRCALEVLGHLADVEIIYGYRLRQMLADTKPVIAPIDQDAWARNLNYLDSPPSELVAFYGLGRHHNLRLLRRLKVSDLSKSAFHPELQREMTVADLVERIGTHGAGHLQQIEKLKAASSGK